MRDLSDLIEFENENTTLDFKAIQYKKGQNENFLKDILSLANSISKDDKYIIIGVKHKPNGERELIGIEDEFVDDATYQQLVDSNIEPSIGFSYFPFEYKDKLFGIIHITDFSDPPYMMKKDFGKLKLGDSFIRKGSYQNRLTRKDIDSQIKQGSESDISQKIDISLTDSEIIKNKNIPRQNFDLPSKIKRKEIEQVIREKEVSKSPFNDFTLAGMTPFIYTPYSNRSLITLQENLKTVDSDFAEDNEYFVYEENAYKLNFFIHNDSSSFLEDVSIEIKIKTNKNFTIRKSIYIKSRPYNPIIKTLPRTATYDEMNYPTVETNENEYKISSNLENVKHKLPTEVFKVPIRIAAFTYDEILLEFEVKLFARNLKLPIIETLQITLNRI